MEIHDKHTYSEMWSKIHCVELDSLTKTVLHYKFSDTFEKKRTNNEISNMLDISEECVRKRLDSVKTNPNFNE
jgi:DNA-directed RNA polymerase sigma subunit (sigma70/sigma32)